jgi:cyclopropane fatty-acyl-phospholipid synthase-like methyltransferase
MVSAQERLLREIASEVAGPRILDVGCGLGGTAIYLATKLNVEVTAITNVEPHVAAVSEFANDAHVGDLVHARVQDAHDVSDLHPFDNVVAVESSCYLDRHRWFAALSHVVRPRGLVHVVDCFLNDAKVEARFNAYWRTRIGRISEYVSAARAGGFVVRRVHPLNDRTLGFWTLSNTWTRDQLDDMDAPERTRLQRSYEEHAWLRDALASNSIQYAFVSFALDPG